VSYSAALKKKLSSLGVKDGTRVVLTSGKDEYNGVVMPHHDFSDPDVMVLKLKSGYNVGIRVDKDTKIEVVEQPKASERKEKEVKKTPGLPNIVLIGTGGTIASFVDYRTGAVRPALSAAQMVDAVPAMREIANVSAKVLFSIFSENMTVGHWQELAKAVAEEINNGADGVIIPHGTDTMGYTAAALSFMLPDVTKPVVLVGAQRSSDRPSSDAYSNLMAATRFCNSGNAGIFVVMHETLGDDKFAVHTGTRVRKMHTSRRDSFRSINAPLAAKIDEKGKIDSSDLPKSSKKKTTVKTDMEENVVLLQYYPGMSADKFKDIFKNTKGVVIAGTGLGHVNSLLIPMIKDACDAGTVVVMTSQCLNGQTNLNVYDNGRDLISAGVISVNDMLPETAYVKLMWALANSKNADEAKRIMKSPLAGEMGQRRTEDV